MLGGCTAIPRNISTPIAGPDVREVRDNPEAHIGKRVRWGGTISDIENLENRTVITVVARRITRKGEPLADTPSTGRFLAETERFLDPEEYKSGRRLTVKGRITGTRSSKIDQYLYTYPVVTTENPYLWEDYVGRDPYPHDRPYYYPYGSYRYPWHHRHFHGFSHYPWY
ncbi:MAG: Outer membrane protein slp [Gammaproteobacteria bacterium]|nr:Outer membrane protein slp [Gammaproteobacteria bacterium]